MADAVKGRRAAGMHTQGMDAWQYLIESHEPLTDTLVAAFQLFQLNSGHFLAFRRRVSSGQPLLTINCSHDRSTRLLTQCTTLPTNQTDSQTHHPPL